MPAVAQEVRQRLLCRSDLHAMSVDGERIASWLRSGRLLFLGHVPAADTPAGDAVYATSDEEVRAELGALLTEHGRTGVELLPENASALLEGIAIQVDTTQEAASNANVATRDPSDMLSEHVVEEGLDSAIDEITEAIDDLLVATDHAPLDLRDDAPFDDAAGNAELHNDVVEVELPSNDAVEEDDIEVELTPEDVAVAPSTVHAPMQRETIPTPIAQPVEVRVALDAQPMAGALQQIERALVALSQKEQPTIDLSRVEAAIRDGLKTLRDTVALVAQRSKTEQKLDQIHEALTDAAEAIRALGGTNGKRVAVRIARNVQEKAQTRGPAAWLRANASLTAARENASAILATASTLLGWSAAAWLYPTDGKLALGALVCANLIACAALLGRKPAQK